MHDDLTFDAFEARFADAYGRYLADAPVEVDAVQVAAAAVADASRRRTLPDRLSRPAWLPQVPRRVLLVVTAAVLLLAVAASLLLVGSLVNQPPLGGSSHLFLTTGALDCQGAIRFDIETGESEAVVECANRLRIAPDGTRAAASGASGIEIIDLADGSLEPMASAPGPNTIPAAWSPRATWLHWASCDENTEGCRGYIGQPGSAATNEIPEGPSGYNGSFIWSADESTFFLWGELGVSVGAGDGSGLVPSSVLPSSPFSIAPDGLTLAFEQGSPGGGSTGSDLYLQPLAGGEPTRVTQNPEGWWTACSSWSPDGEVIAVTVAHRGTSAAPEPVPAGELLVITPDGTVRHRWPLPTGTGLECDVLLGRASGITWTQDARHVLLAPIQIDENAPHAPFVVNVETGKVTLLENLRGPILSPDGRLVAALGGLEDANPDATDNPATIEIVDLAAGTTRTLASVTVGPWSVLVWAP
jgi:hypothetical protein